MTRIYTKQKWTPAELTQAMHSRGWIPTPLAGWWQHRETGHRVNINEPMRDGREYWHQLAERHQTPPSAPVPF